jgi:peptidoglycan hydrolase-like protein with peptidoglycan-binding domain
MQLPEMFLLARGGSRATSAHIGIGRMVWGGRVAVALAGLLSSSFAPGPALAQGRIGPSFECAGSGVANQPLAQIICSSDELARLDLSYVIAYQALRQTLDDKGRTALRDDANSFVVAVVEQCELPKSSALNRRPTQREIVCIKGRYELQRQELLNRLSGPGLEEAKLEPEEALAIQRALQAKALLPATAAIDGLFGPTTRTALASWQRSVGLHETGFGSRSALDQLSEAAGQLAEKSNFITKERIGFGSHAGESAYVISIEGVGTTKAIVKILLDWDREVQACSDEYLTYTPDVQDKDGYTRCVAFAKKSFKGDRVLTAQANCETGEMLGFGATKARFYVGQIKQSYKEDGKSEDRVYYTHVLHYEGFRVGDYGYTGVSVDGAIFRRLCPTSFTQPPKIDLPEISLKLDCDAALERAKDIATESGRRHVLNEKIIDAWDVQSEGSTWDAARCSAKVEFNTGERGTMKYEEVPQHGKYFIKVRIVP